MSPRSKVTGPNNSNVVAGSVFGVLYEGKKYSIHTFLPEKQQLFKAVIIWHDSEQKTVTHMSPSTIVLLLLLFLATCIEKGTMMNFLPEEQKM